MKKLIVALLSGISLFCQQVCFAQNQYRIEAFGTVGGTRYDAESGKSFNIGGGVGIRPFSTRSARLYGLAFEFELNRSFSSDAFPTAGRTTATGAVVYHFSASHIQPYLLVGMGGSSLGSYGLNRGSDPTHGVGVAGTGVRVFLTKHVSLRPEFRAYWGILRGRLQSSGGVSNYLYRGSAGISYHW